MGYELEGEPRFVRDGGSSPLPGHYEAGFRSGDGVIVERFITDKSRAALLRMIEALDAERGEGG